MIYIKIDENNVQLAGTVANQQMLDDGYTEYNGVIPVLGDYQHYEMVTGVLTATDNTDLQEVYSKDVADAVQIVLDDKAIEFRYDNMISARAMAGIPLTGTDTATEISMHSEAISLAQWYLACWGKVTDIETDVLNSVIPRPTVQEVVDQLPAYV